jgi:hypothetical protein
MRVISAIAIGAAAATVCLGLAAHLTADPAPAVASSEGQTAVAPATTLPSDENDFDRNVWPILQSGCGKCHLNGNRKGGLRLDSREQILLGGDTGPAAVAHQSAKSLLIDRITTADSDDLMPKKGPPLPKAKIDAPIARLVLDLEKSGHLDRTLIVVASEFSRDMMLEGKPENKVKDQVMVPDVMQKPEHYGMHRHFTGAGSVLMFGGGIKKGFLCGKTADERPCTTVENPVVIEDLHATIYHAMGISPKLAYDIERRPFYATRDGSGKPIMELFATDNSGCAR